jgi:hypothetical protein
VRRGRAVRARRRIPAVTGTLAVVAGAAVALTTLLPSGQAAHRPTAGLAAWTVVNQADGDIEVTVNQLQDPAGLQSTLNADGAPASVTFSGQFNPACSRDGSPQSQGTLINSIVTGQLQQGGTSGDAFSIDPSAIPSGLGLQIAPTTTPPGQPGFIIGLSIVYASQQCTGIS